MGMQMALISTLPIQNGIDENFQKKKPLNLTILIYSWTLYQNTKHSGILRTDDGKWKFHVSYITRQACNRIRMLRKSRFSLKRKSLERWYFSFVLPTLEYSDIVKSYLTQQQANNTDTVQTEAARIVTGATKLDNVEKRSKKRLFNY